MDQPRHIGPKELAARYDVSVATVYKWNHEGTGPAYLRIGNHVRYRLRDVLKWEDGCHVPRPPVARSSR